MASHLRRRIVRGELRAGETLPSEIHLMEQFKVSRPTLREAFRILEAESLIGVRRGSRGGAQVLEPDPAVAARHIGLLLQMQGTTIQDVYEARMVTEPACAGLLAKVRTEQDLTDLRDVVERLRTLVEAGFEQVPDLATWSRSTYRFHELIMQRCGNRTLAIQGAVLAEIVDTHLQGALARGLRGSASVPERFQKTLRSYKKLIQLVETQNSAGAEKHWRRHMEVAAQYIFLHDPVNTPLVDIFG
ncbi:FadR/GntR family transcriptional regulator [Frankia sp. EI5c]|uniref:FadR/GntR family transcriptional regulator n=1 Tax=Frankia sp. EI5c TaxID=683316 RepID=UPI00210115FF|nr:FCD domain-containing protein [Frankia sp. EI5c]